jgi:phosphoserine phosphatase RsbU/P
VFLTTHDDWVREYPALAPHIKRFPGFAAVPLAGTEITHGGLVLSFRRQRTLEDHDKEFLIALGRQAGQAFERARLFENRAYVAQKLQEGLLPDALAEIPGMEAAVRYQSISGGGEVGGDFYDLFEAGHGRWAIAIGDVCGKGTEAAVVTGLARHTVRAVARMEDGPADVLAFLNDELRRHSDPPSFCTVGFGIIEREPEAFRIRLASGGHPYPLRLTRDGDLEEIRVTGTMLGAAREPELEEVTVTLSPGDALIFYTDGVPDARSEQRERFGEERLRAAVEAARDRSAEGIAAAVEAAVDEHQPVALNDDRAILVVRATPA